MEDIDGGLHPAVDGQSLDKDEEGVFGLFSVIGFIMSKIFFGERYSLLKFSLQLKTSIVWWISGFEGDLKTLLPEVAKNKHLKHLAIGRNFSSVKPK